MKLTNAFHKVIHVYTLDLGSILCCNNTTV